MKYLDKTGLFDKRGNEICIGHIIKLKLDDGSTRKFKVRYKTVVRDVVNLNRFENGTSKVAITGIVFEWEGNNLFPCVDERGIADNERMEIIGIY